VGRDRQGVTPLLPQGQFLQFAARLQVLLCGCNLRVASSSFRARNSGFPILPATQVRITLGLCLFSTAQPEVGGRRERGLIPWRLRIYGNPIEDISHAYNVRSTRAPAIPPLF